MDNQRVPTLDACRAAMLVFRLVDAMVVSLGFY